MHFLLRKSQKRKYYEIEDDQKEELKNQVEEFKKNQCLSLKRVFELTSKIADLTKNYQDYKKWLRHNYRIVRSRCGRWGWLSYWWINWN